ncbi:hypothetical protein [Infirmifilum sp. SLHALR2]
MEELVSLDPAQLNLLNSLLLSRLVALMCPAASGAPSGKAERLENLALYEGARYSEPDTNVSGRRCRSAEPRALSWGSATIDAPSAT